MAIKDKVVVITGASSGIGQATAEVLASAGANVVIGARRIDRLKQIAGEFSDGQVLYQQTDVTQRDQVKSLVDLAVSKFGKLDVLYNNAGLMPLSQLAELKVNEWDRMIDVNLKGVLYGIAAALPIMIKQKHGHVITTDSVAGHVVHPGTAVYAGTKYAIQAVMDGLRQEQVGNHIKTTMISPGAVETELYRTISDETVREQTKKQEQENGLKPIDIAHAVAYAIDQPDDVAINEILLRPRSQKV
ncbi:SDR family oxidoreductase [Lentilactobacillus kefiri]|uniref:Oxidoreductase, short chain dehydrogenase reductase family protein n=2 Tax=Lentilactobacillus kefiri TaxID=33962 RepID=A0A8E1RJT4_LENKE|nr:SDR family oxidoreductase [Lentilactobacillus kefiri]KRL59234.1 oxidoreductase, short chain dehydrogenase reductase family protein [Lentilactobacillus parakefiri DSM 10551]KRM53567.1 oxidoreductase, short chain dehydrogenase reductase family protein [Lentilactobacillus kefiri DSM 20587 = JCM 5818]MCJ2162447.1 SDR family oxidoreductase [Lentilactobacillus kefiri]MCP9369634.1 SDR family oxidoreductase [Lentilactobacillus kefiri]MDH5109527.1 SDR family oxidoreductase [Lentilactobacillus kefiri